MRWPNWWAKPDCDAMPSESHTMNFIKLFFAALCTAWLLAACAVSDGLPKPQALPALTAGDTRWFKLEAQDEAGNIEQASCRAKPWAARAGQTMVLSRPMPIRAACLPHCCPCWTRARRFIRSSGRKSKARPQCILKICANYGAAKFQTASISLLFPMAGAGC